MNKFNNKWISKRNDLGLQKLTSLLAMLLGTSDWVVCCPSWIFVFYIRKRKHASRAEVIGIARIIAIDNVYTTPSVESALTLWIMCCFYWDSRIILWNEEKPPFEPRTSCVLRAEDEYCNHTRSKGPVSPRYTSYFLWLMYWFSGFLSLKSKAK